MHIWTLTKWTKNISKETSRKGIRFRYDKSVDAEVKRACSQFAKWMRVEYYFPIRVPVYVKDTKTIRAKDGDKVKGIFFEPNSYSDEPYIKIAVGDYCDLVKKHGKDNALAMVLSSLAHEITHYYQWINSVKLTEIGAERQASQYAKYILYEYSQTREHP